MRSRVPDRREDRPWSNLHRFQTGEPSAPRSTSGSAGTTTPWLTSSAPRPRCSRPWVGRPRDPDAVLTTIVENARRLCRSEAAHLYLLEDDTFRLMGTVGLSEESRQVLTEHPITMDRETLTGRVGLERRTLQIPDVLADPDFGRHDLQRSAGFRTVIAAPLIVDDAVVGALNVWRNEVRPFDDREMGIVSAFAVQAAIAVNGVASGPAARDARSGAGPQGRRAGGAPRGRRGGQLHASTSRTFSTRSPSTRSHCPAPTAARSWSTPSGTAGSSCAASTARLPRSSSSCAP